MKHYAKSRGQIRDIYKTNMGHLQDKYETFIGQIWDIYRDSFLLLSPKKQLHPTP